MKIETKITMKDKRRQRKMDKIRSQESYSHLRIKNYCKDVKVIKLFNLLKIVVDMCKVIRNSSGHV